MKRNKGNERAFTVTDLLALCAALFLCVLIVLPALGRTHNNNALTQSINNLRQLTSAWSMYSAQNNGRLVNSYPDYGGNTNAWCWGTAKTGGSAGTYTFGGADPRGIERGDLWPYVQSLTPYKCPDDKRIVIGAAAPFKNQPILRSYSMNSYLAGATLGTAHDVAITSPQTIDQCNYKLFTKENQIPKPAGIFVFVEEDGDSIDDGMFLVDMGQSVSRYLVDMPARHHANSYPISFADGHVETYHFIDSASSTWTPGGSYPYGGIHDWAAITNITTVPNP